MRVTPRFFVFVLCIVCLWVAGGFARRYINLVLLQNKIIRVEREIAAIEHRNEAIKEQIEYMQSDSYVEKIAREKLGLIKPGETLYIPVRNAGPDDPLDVPKRSGRSTTGGY